jgi:hypothetical protein
MLNVLKISSLNVKKMYTNYGGYSYSLIKKKQIALQPSSGWRKSALFFMDNYEKTF